MHALGTSRGEPVTTFEEFFHDAEARLRQALVASYGPVDGREATVDALSWGWEHWEQLTAMSNPVGYLYRVGQSAVRRFGTRSLPIDVTRPSETRLAMPTPELLPALARLSIQQRTAVLLVHAYGWSQADVAALLEINPSTVREHLNRAVARLREDLEASDE